MEDQTISRELDLVSGGRAGWDVTTIASSAAAQNYGEPRALPDTERRAIAAEFVEISRKLWDSWEDDAIVLDRAGGQATQSNQRREDRRSMSVPLSILDLMPIPSRGTGAQAIHNTLELAQLADALGYERYWLAEHHNFAGLAAVAPEVLIGVIARETRRIRVGSGGILLPNYAPLKVAETFRTLEGLAPGRIDLGIGRAPNQDKRTALALRGSAAALDATDDIARLLAELEGFAEVAPSPFPDDHPLREVVASPEGVPLPPIWLLGSGQRSAQLAAERGRGFAAAYHFSPGEAAPTIRAYKASFQPSTYLARPHALASVAVICAETDELAEGLKLAGDLTALRRLNGERGSPPTIEEARAYEFTPEDQEKLRVFTTVYGSPARVQRELSDLAARLGADELILVTSIADHALRRRSLELVAEDGSTIGNSINVSSAVRPRKRRRASR